MSVRGLGRSGETPVGVAARDGRPGSLDGNFTSDLLSWMLPPPGERWEELDDEDLARLMNWTLMGHLAWCVFPVDNV